MVELSIRSGLVTERDLVPAGPVPLRTEELPNVEVDEELQEQGEESAPQARFAWQAWTLGTSIDVRGSLATNWVGFGAAGSCVAGVTLSAPQARFAWQAWTLGTSIDVRGSLATNWVGFGAAGSCVAGVTLSAPQARCAWQAWYFGYLHRCPEAWRTVFSMLKGKFQLKFRCKEGF